ncbi:unnamed protein product [Mycena citricolor]|uniref:Uncharacterized protein n=1 Tax=Mycena citricolor TaxID=2018698 RepID=A0AAD2K0H8_9AGAR|nr:unnamed protein product [Mycena citricolor]
MIYNQHKARTASDRKAMEENENVREEAPLLAASLPALDPLPALELEPPPPPPCAGAPVLPALLVRLKILTKSTVSISGGMFCIRVLRTERRSAWALLASVTDSICVADNTAQWRYDQ